MKRRDFLKYSTLTAAGGWLAPALPFGSCSGPGHGRSLVLCVVAGIPEPAFAALFDPAPGGIGHSGTLLTGLRYNGHAAGHRIAFESILHGRYLTEAESGREPLVAAPLYRNAGPGARLVTSARPFLRPGKGETGAEHFCVSYNENGLPSVESAPGTDTGAVVRRLAERPLHRFASEDLCIAETACMLLEHGQPALLGVHFMGADAAHGNPTSAEANTAHIKEGINRLWQTARARAHGKDRTVFVVLPDFGRNGSPNSMRDAGGHAGTDHSILDEHTKKTACFVAGKEHFAFDATAKDENPDILSVLYGPDGPLRTSGSTARRAGF